ncbi:hypothetical protein GX50_01560 [[Emmonsia] crescens]|uniref:Uncharacterized protein n=1 Tax=[Emmonsia] crescens TaxID=73230 RepID=A0A2B7ZQX1_9EURO|nr:hypothetical protein GX50_01560 [Emmonsia crescens]
MHRHDVVGHHVVFPCTGNVVTGGAGTGACVEEYGGVELPQYFALHLNGMVREQLQLCTPGEAV